MLMVGAECLIFYLGIMKLVVKELACRIALFMAARREI
jgi:hypothetical protein